MLWVLLGTHSGYNSVLERVPYGSAGFDTLPLSFAGLKGVKVPRTGSRVGEGQLAKASRGFGLVESAVQLWWAKSAAGLGSGSMLATVAVAVAAGRAAEMAILEKCSAGHCIAARRERA